MSLRLIGGYRVFAFTLQRHTAEVESAGADLALLAQQLTAGNGRTDLDPQWMMQVSAPPQRGSVDPILREREAKHRTWAVHYVFNAARVCEAQRVRRCQHHRQ
ncbi:MAG: hypothetical protein EXS14_07605 [Planctomycetes bacterium]|nr:hypothetical protein [Planctomycetota bacterium]